MVLLHFGCHVSIIFPLSLFFFFYEQGASSGNSTGIAQRARHPDELKREDGKWMIDIDYYLSQQVLFCFFFFRFSIKLSNKCSNLLLPLYGLIEGLILPCRFILWYHVFVRQFKVQVQNAWLIA